ncbi:sugar ABC transporter substrate-binding protein [Eubacterium oxidoreducens]|uniref:Ribose transport system substrate-binding protein n=1 Tax=Eubacterium oxidoreducens TaxID=1732 RepID=A0A1G6C0G1_EUBOX|nr:sugar ABC transporter substrate-binding protein [Eubacterium oxidoreducens]SDB26403.1 ribose transport system substrate-binding protein [Eubacterium oxidoreducens]
MKKNVSRTLAAICAGAMAVSLAACGNTSQEGTASSSSNESTTKSDMKIGIVVKTATNAHFQDISYGAMIAGEENGVEVIVQNTTTESDIDGQIQKCEDLVSQGVDALILTANDSDGVSAAVQNAHDNDVKFVTVDTEITNDWGDDVAEYMPVYIGVDHQAMAKEMAEKIFEAMGGEGKIVILRGVDAASSSQERTAGFKEALEEYPNIEVVAEQSASYDQDTATQKMSDILQKESDIDAVLCCNDLMAAGAITALKEQGIEVGGDEGVKVAGIDGNVIALESIEAGEMYCTAYDWSILQGYYAVEQAINLVNGGEVEDDTMMTPDTIITADNIDEYLQHGEELSKWSMGDAVGQLSDYMTNFIQMGKDLGVE